ncbi:DUF1206 domain-containing protein [Mycolicibacterium confluentis]|uniref:Membrane protein n=1 Tax=Mycolicibacterium confluentis TaxID=28047 RepID=A0A7I7XWT1_9MYCO|nr:DUF1206 domain-containing protein [Mycolicibacterium confluentis]MCV7321928.1 DUF1206 domain-containing protein [Mycolicibacterium confluentis]ORV32177.1 hypothetical protein AWB99_11035 [Mycolicibacterium confluentis]BBZ33748.1 membrane protein [Mycolicibacterium confluentis]
MSHGQIHRAVDDATSTDAFEYGARAGYAISAVLHLLVAYIIVRLALNAPTGGGQNADQSGALATLGGQTGGAIALWLAAVGLFALALWRLAETVVGSHPNEPSRGDHGLKKQSKRVKSLALAVVYCGLAISAIRFATGQGQSSGQQNAGLSARLMQSGGGKAVLIVVGLVVIGVGGYHVYKGASQKFLDDLRGSSGSAVTVTGTVGYLAKGSVLSGAGLLVIIATISADPAKAAGIDAAVKTLGQAPFGRVLLLASALGIAAYGAYCLVLARYARM